MNKTLILIKIALINLFSNNKFAASKKGKKAAAWTMVLLPAGVMLYISVVYSFLLMEALPTESRFIMPVLMTIMTFVMLITLSFFNSGGHLFGFRDFDLLMSLPVKRSSVMLSKLLSFLLMDYFFAFFLMGPYIIIFGIKTAQSVLYYLIGFLGFVFIPLIPMVFASLGAIFINSFTGNFKYKNMIRNVFYILLFGLIMFGSMQMQRLLLMDALSATALLANTKRYLLPVYLLSEALLHSNIISLILYALLNTVVFGLFIFLFNRIFIKINMNAHQGYKVKNFKLRELKTSSRFIAFFKLQTKRYFGSTMYLMNTIVGPLMLIVFMIIGALSGLDQARIYVSTFDQQGLLLPMAAAAIMFTSSMCMITSSTISLEGRNIDLLKSLPINTASIFLAKIALQVVVNLVINIVALIIGVVLYDVSAITALFLLLISIVIAIMFAVLGLVTNLIFPKMEWDSETIVVKQSMSVLITIFGGMAIIGVHALGFILTIGYLSLPVFILICLFIDALATYLMWLYLLNGGTKRFNRL
ncbi:MAG: ABC transporter permease [Erysipelotrichaceae bacterium]|nr:ABC transporter permease [Erysipelotrichaceae bacterium]